MGCTAAPVRLQGVGGRWRRVEPAALAILLFGVVLVGGRQFGPATGAPLASDPWRRLLLGSPREPAPVFVQPGGSALLAVTATVGRDEGLAAALVRAGVSKAEADAINAAVAAKLGGAPVKAGTALDLVLRPMPAPGQPRSLVSLQLQAGMDSRLRAERRPGGWRVATMPIPVDATPLRIRGAVGDNFARSALAAGAPSSAIQQYLQALDAKSTLATDLRPEDTFDMVFEYRLSASGERQAGGLIMAGLERDGTPLVQLLRDRMGAFVPSAGPDGAFSRADRLLQPVIGRVTSRFGMRLHPILGYERMHSGVDLAAAWGTPVRAVRSGAVSFAGWNGGHGEYVMIRHAGGLVSGYGHMSRVAVVQGRAVAAGEVIGYVGATGLATGPHLHFELFRDGRAIDPMTVEPPQLDEATRQREWQDMQSRLAWFRRLIPGAALRAAHPAQPASGS